MIRKKAGIILLGLFISAILWSNSFSQDEARVMKRYDYSSPKASFESLKKAIEEKDIEGILIHYWQSNKLFEGTSAYKKSFEDFLIYISENMSKEAIIMAHNELRPVGPSLKVTELDFVREKEREHDKEAGIDITTCWITLERKSDGKQFDSLVLAYNYDGTNEWWITPSPLGE